MANNLFNILHLILNKIIVLGHHESKKFLLAHNGRLKEKSKIRLFWDISVNKFYPTG